MQINKTSATQNFTNQTQPSFKGLSGLGKKVASDKSWLKGFAKNAEYNGISMGLPSLLLLLYGATIVPRFAQAHDKHERREVLTRDFLSITAILFLEKALSKGFSVLNSVKSGFALNFKPKAAEGTTGFKKFLHYINPVKGATVLSSKELVSKYSNLEGNKNGIADFIDFIKQQGGNLKKVFAFDEKVKGHVEKLLGKTIKDATAEEIEHGLKNAKKSDASLKGIYDAFRGNSNKFVQKAKLMNSTFAFVSMCLLVPGFMIWIQRFNAKVTKKAVAKELEAKKAQEAANKTTTPVATEVPVIVIASKVMKTAQNSSSASQRQAYADFLGQKQN